MVRDSGGVTLSRKDQVGMSWWRGYQRPVITLTDAAFGEGGGSPMPVVRGTKETGTVDPGCLS